MRRTPLRLESTERRSSQLAAMYCADTQHPMGLDAIPSDVFLYAAKPMARELLRFALPSNLKPVFRNAKTEWLFFLVLEFRKMEILSDGHEGFLACFEKQCACNLQCVYAFLPGCAQDD